MLRKAAVVGFSGAALAGLAGALLAPAPAGASSWWSSPIDLSAPSDDPSIPQVAVNAQGDAVAVWNGEIGVNVVAQAAVRKAGRTWQAPINISAPSTLDLDPRVALDAQGNAVAVWRRYDGNEYIVQSAARPENGRWRAPVNLSAAGHSAGGAQVAVDPQGNAVAIWQRFKSRNVIAVQSAVRPVGGSWQAPVELSASVQDSSTHPQVAVAATGDAVAVWKNDGVSSFIVKAAARPAGGQAPVEIPPRARPTDFARAGVSNGRCRRPGRRRRGLGLPPHRDNLDRAGRGADGGNVAAAGQPLCRGPERRRRGCRRRSSRQRGRGLGTTCKDHADRDHVRGAGRGARSGRDLAGAGQHLHRQPKRGQPACGGRSAEQRRRDLER